MIEEQSSSLKSNIDSNTANIKNNKISVDTNLKISGNAADAKVTGDAIGSLKEDLDNVLDIQVTSYPNKVNPAEFQYNKTINGSGQIVDSDNQYITNKFSVSKGDTVYLTILKGDLFLDVSSVTMMYLCCFKKDGTLSGDGRNQFSQSKKIEDNETAYCIVAMSNQTVGSTISITLNNFPTSKDTFEEYKPDKVDSVRISTIENRLDSYIPAVEKIIDFWGDSRIEMGKDDDSSIAYKTGELLGNSFITTNNGISGQCSGAVAFRFGASEVFGTVENNEIGRASCRERVSSPV